MRSVLPVLESPVRRLFPAQGHFVEILCKFERVCLKRGLLSTQGLGKMMFDQPPVAPIAGPSNRISLEGVSPGQKRSIDGGPTPEAKRPRYSYYLKLESESSTRTSEDDTESIYSCQGYETELVQDTPDTDTKSEYSGSDVDYEVEYEVEELSEEDNPFLDAASSSGTEEALAAAGAIAAVICDTSMEAWLTDVEESDNSSVGDTELVHPDFWTCVQCKSHNNNPSFRYCQKCFQMKKNLYPPRPRGHRKRPKKSEKNKQSSSAVLSQDSGVGSTQESTSYSIIATSIASSSKELTEEEKRLADKEKPKSESEAKSESEGVSENEGKVESERDKKSETKDSERTEKVEEKSSGSNLCIICADAVQNCAFVHNQKVGCMCCCYKCALRTWLTHKKCPACMRKVKNIIRIYKT